MCICIHIVQHATVGSITEAIHAVHELVSGELGDDEPMLRARFIDYIRTGD